jgi:hypothetical protein
MNPAAPVNRMRALKLSAPSFQLVYERRMGDAFLPHPNTKSENLS